ncbi:hypothetical protein TRVL_08710 [Trypanosoma vivax]|nr:hypothetical protein TRVL_08710 [Trypanosoma vivax]
MPCTNGIDPRLTLACWRRCLGFLLHGVQMEPHGTQLWEKYIATRYSEPQRHYHTLNHLEEMMGHLAHFQLSSEAAHRLPETGARRLIVELAMLFHDSVYDPQRKDNEECSCDWFRAFWAESRDLAAALMVTDNAPTECQTLLWDDPALAEAVEEGVVALILQTKDHLSEQQCDSRPWAALGKGISADLALFLDLDLAVLGSEPPRYREYAAEVRLEYAWLCDAEFARGRSAFLQGLLKYPCWYRTQFFHDKLEKVARANVTDELVTLRGHCS